MPAYVEDDMDFLMLAVLLANFLVMWLLVLWCTASPQSGQHKER